MTEEPELTLSQQLRHSSAENKPWDPSTAFLLWNAAEEIDQLKSRIEGMSIQLAASRIDYTKASNEREELNEALHRAREAINARSEDIVNDIIHLIEDRDEHKKNFEFLRESMLNMSRNYDTCIARNVELEAKVIELTTKAEKYAQEYEWLKKKFATYVNRQVHTTGSENP
jgi:chromosome segregation ATPase